MKALAELQRAFGRAIEDGEDEVALCVRGAGAAARARLAFYRASVRAQRHDALASAYPVVRRLVGDDFFREMARRYAALHPSRSGDLNLFGGRFADFLAADGDARALAYLPDVARLEWACHESLLAADAPAFDALALAALPPERQGEVRLRFDPSVRLLESAHAIAAILEANRPDRDGTPERGDGPDRVLVWRVGGAVRVRRVDPAEWALLRSIEGGATLEQAAASMGEREAQASLASSLAALAKEGAIAGFTLAPDPA